MKTIEVRMLLLNVFVVLVAWAANCMNRTNTLLCFIAIGLFYLLTVVCRVLHELKILNKNLKGNDDSNSNNAPRTICFNANDIDYETDPK